jgi:TPR repeat protein
MNSIGAAYRDGKGGVSKSRKQAIEWFRKAAAGGEEKGIKNLGEIGVQYKGAPDPDGKVRKPSFIRSIACIIAGLICAAIGAGIVSWLLGRIPFIGPLATIAGALFCGAVGFYMFEESETKRALKGTMGVVLVLSALIGISTGGKEIIAKLLPSAPKAAATQTAAVSATVTADALNMREGPSADTAVVTQLKKGDALTVTEDTGGNWVKVEAGDTSGYVRRDYITTGAAGE